MDFEKLIRSRRCVRNFENKAVSDKDIIEIVNSARWAPSGGNCQPWHFYVIKDKNIIQEIFNQVYKADWILKAPVIIVVCADIPRSESRYKQRGRDLYCIQDTAAAIQNMLLCVENLNLGACWVGAFNENNCIDLLKLTENLRPVALIPIGYPVNKPLPPYRRPLEEVVTFIGQTENIELKQEENRRAFEHCDMGNTLFNDVNLSMSDFNNINMNKASFNDINMTQVNFSCLNLNNSTFRDISFQNVEITSASLDGTYLHDNNLESGKGLKIENCDLSNTEINNCNIKGLKINGIEIEKLLSK
jgi:nitroreductase